ncbi:hypothetical protein [Streptomyces sp. ISL-11]|uniref:hypothetical protein n=1 Tax=Streptomyces sp. ISL-11 TaxID=2819174 RepID=UPI001BE6BEE2|nr:hypothetical protein [Streptomyces sp. ISL-11]MBT2385232.1 hypothetical protein [Streptomyces sp. ISL-11]
MGEGPTQFEHASTESMLLMLEGADPDELIHKGAALKAAQGIIEGIGKDLRDHVSGTPWEGEGGKAFHEWGHNFANQILKLADYAEVAGSRMNDAGGELKRVLLDTASVRESTRDMLTCFADGGKEKARMEAMEKARPILIPAMNNLASSYWHAKEDIKGAQEPRFAPLPGSVLPSDRQYDAWSQDYGTPGGQPDGHFSGEQSVARSGAGSVASVAPQHVPSSHKAENPGQLPNDPLQGNPAASNNTGTNIDGTTLTPAPAAPTPSGTSLLPPPGGSGNDRLSTLPPLPSVTMPPRNGSSSPDRSAPGRVGMLKMPIGGPGPLGRVGGVGDEGTVRSPLIPRPDTGIVGGTPTQVQPGAGPARGVPRGTVIGGESQQMGRGTVGGGTPGVMNPGSGSQGYNGATRRLVSEPGGIVGGPRGAQGVRREFTPGGSGLVRERPIAAGHPGSMLGSPSAAQQRSDSREQRAAPAYLVEDEETWVPERRTVVPPVIE